MGQILELNNFILSMLNSLPGKKVEGKKRFQKLAMLLQFAGLEFDATFRLHKYGPFSFDVSNAMEELSFIGAISEEVKPLGMYGTFLSEFSLPEENDPNIGPLPKKYTDSLIYLHDFTTIELEVASTVAYFLHLGKMRDVAIEQTKKMKPTKSSPRVLAQAENIINRISLN